MTRSLLALTLAAALVGSSVSISSAQETTSGPTAHPIALAQGQSGGAGTSGGISSGGAATEAPAPLPPAEAAAPLPPGPPAAPEQAEFLSNGALIAGGIAVTAIIVCAIACFSSSSSTTTSTTVQHH